LLGIERVVSIAQKAKGAAVGQDYAIGVKVMLAGIDNAVQHGLVQQKIAHPFGNYDVVFGLWQISVLQSSLNQLNILNLVFPKVKNMNETLIT